MNLSNGWPMMGSTGEIILFACTAIVMVACALGVLFFKKAAHSVICMVGVMLGLAVLYIANNAPFLGVAQIVVYTGAIMMLFLFVIMLIGIGTSDDYARQSRGAIVAAVLGGLGLIVIVTTAILKSVPDTYAAQEVDPYSNQPITDLAITLFQEHWLSMELAGCLLISAAVGAMLLTRSDRLGPKVTQLQTARNKMRAFGEKGARIGQLPAPGVYAQSNAADVPAVSGETLGPLEESVPRVLRVRGLARTIGEVTPEVSEQLALARNEADGSEALEESPYTIGRTPDVPRSGSFGMPGAAAPTGLAQPRARKARTTTPTEKKEESK
ncbi:NADH-quinone oxidoreductase subunit J [uncultured Actinomyces sp.]|uniref:NADH-quinone oxidoreductase subunit J n=1 Tax=uncultured Actinomyces sp. TaxID=249061 RepID=UPI0028ED9D3D|nr:NADH-quinone oxidoreductase subunit J [uncultured Actinomyces sp.]